MRVAEGSWDAGHVELVKEFLVGIVGGRGAWQHGCGCKSGLDERTRIESCIVVETIKD